MTVAGHATLFVCVWEKEENNNQIERREKGKMEGDATEWLLWSGLACLSFHSGAEWETRGTLPPFDMGAMEITQSVHTNECEVTGKNGGAVAGVSLFS